MTEEQRMKNLTPPTEKVDVILDTDTFNEIDDQFALCYLLKNSEKLNCIGITAAPFFNGNSTSPRDGMEKSYDEIRKLLSLSNREDVPVFKGSVDYLTDEKTPRASDAADFIAEKAKDYSPEKPLYVVAIGAITNVASALLAAPWVKENTVVVWLGGNSLHTEHTHEFNMFQDIAAARVVMSCGVPFVQLPCAGVVDYFTVTEYELKYWLYDKNPVSDYLARNTVSACRPAGKETPWSKVIWDVTAVAWLLSGEKHFCEWEILPTHLPDYTSHYEKTSLELPMCYVKRINRDSLMADLFEKLIG